MSAAARVGCQAAWWFWVRGVFVFLRDEMGLMESLMAWHGMARRWHGSGKGKQEEREDKARHGVRFFLTYPEAYAAWEARRGLIERSTGADYIHVERRRQRRTSDIKTFKNRLVVL